MKKYNIFVFTWLLFCLLLNHSLGYSQQRTLSGTVSDEVGSPLPGASVVVKGTTRGTQTDFDGNFKLAVQQKDVLVISYIGYQSIEKEVANNTVVNISLTPDNERLGEVVVVGYGTLNKNVLTNAIVKVSGDELTKEPVVNPIQALQNKVAGAHIIASDAPGAAPNILIRGLNTLRSDQKLLYVVDGILTDNISNINTADILDISVLKDAASLAIYGNRAANGAVIVTTRQGKKGESVFSFDSSTGVRDISYKVPMANAQQYVQYSNEALLRTRLEDDDPSNDLLPLGYFPQNQTYDTNWLDAISQLGFVTNNSLSVSGGTDKLTSFFSGSFYNEEGILKDNTYNRFTVRENLRFKATEKLTLTHTASLQLDGAQPKPYSVFTTAYKQAPIVPVYRPDGKFGSSVGINNVGNPVSGLHFHDEKTRDLRLQGSLKLDYKFSNAFTYTSQFSIEHRSGKSYNFVNELGVWLAHDPTRIEDNYQPADPNDPRKPNTILYVYKGSDYRWFADNYITYDKTFGLAHNLKLTLGFTAEEGGSDALRGSRWNVPSNSLRKFNITTGDDDDNQKIDGSLSENNRTHSYLARANYDFDGKYVVSGTFRRDGSSRFKKGFRYGNFYSVGLGWVASHEAFLENSSFDLLKFRGSYGKLGNQGVPLNILTATTGSAGFYPFGSNQTVQQGITIDGTVVEDLTWETTEELNIGVEFTLFNNKLSGEIDVYRRVTPNLISLVRLPDVFGFKPYWSHVGELENKGVEGRVSWHNDESRELQYDVTLTASHNSNELTKITNRYFDEQTGGSLNNGQYTKRVREGHPLGSFFLYEVEGIDDRGKLVYKDRNNNGTIDEGDRRFFGSYLPDITAGFNLGLAYKQFDFNMDLYANVGGKVYNGKKAQRFSNENIEQRVFNHRWTSGTPSNTGPHAFNEVPLASNYYLESGDFLRINNLTLGYTLPKKAAKSFFDKFRFYVTAKNLLTLKRFSGFTPELVGAPLGGAGVELDAYPTLRSIYIGINTTF
jgi:TonB-linked SusC/RagA family outer membrane protein